MTVFWHFSIWVYFRLGRVVSNTLKKISPLLTARKPSPMKFPDTLAFSNKGRELLVQKLTHLQILPPKPKFLAGDLQCPTCGNQSVATHRRSRPV